MKFPVLTGLGAISFQTIGQKRLYLPFLFLIHLKRGQLQRQGEMNTKCMAIHPL